MRHDTLLDLSRWRWALTAAMHITFPAVTVGTSVFLVLSYYMCMRSDNDVWLRCSAFGGGSSGFGLRWQVGRSPC
jgi:cytochrome bd ubiquinol oxidase subunit I